ncbi:conserved hypothetical protein [Sporisorium reilianum SRZ2]|uniref:Uncharacterized protein n=1 Tax=Sporisorium reilianum (strain SRZ2) TaxID=999809 RepID=E7A0Y9_SPORE|nr:conserved hypothetical protein [Sporisorium reilianum SRZ2]
MSAQAASSEDSSTHHRRASALLPSLDSLGSFLNAGAPSGVPSSSSASAAAQGGLSTDAELMISDPVPTEWADEPRPVDAAVARQPARDLSQEVRFRGQQPRRPATTTQTSFIAFPAASPSMSSPSRESKGAGSRTSSAASIARDSDRASSARDATTASTSTGSSVAADTVAAATEGTIKGEAMLESHGRTASLSAAQNINDALASTDSSVQRHAGFRARSINSIRGLAAAWVPARFVSASQPPSSAASSASSNDDASDTDSPRRRDALALTTAVVRHGAGEGKRPVKLDRRRLDKAVSLAVEAAQAAEEDERLWDEKQRAKKSRARKARPALQAAWSSSSRSGVDEQRQVARRDAGGTSDEEESEEEDDDLGFSLDLYISSLGYLISAISDKEAPGLSSKQRHDIRQRLEDGMSKLGFDAKAELAKAEAMKRELELEREKLQLQQQAAAASPTANVVHHHYHTAVPANSSIFGDGANFSRAHAAAKASSRGSSSLAGKISSSVLDVGLHIGAGALSALSANLAAIAPRSGGSRKEMDDPRITDLDNDEELQGVGPGSRRGSASQPASGAATPRTAWTRAISQNSKQWELAVAFASTAASALASSLGAVARSDDPSPAPTTTAVAGSLTREQQHHLAQWGHPLDPDASASAEDRLILLSASLARALKRSPLPTQLYQLLRQLVSLLAAIDARYSLSEKGAQMAVRETSRAMRFVRRHDLHVKAVRVAWAAAEAAVAALEAYRDEKGFVELQQQQQQQQRVEGITPYGGEAAGERLAIEGRSTLEAKLDDAERRILEAAREGGGKQQKVEMR